MTSPTISTETATTMVLETTAAAAVATTTTTVVETTKTRTLTTTVVETLKRTREERRLTRTRVLAVNSTMHVVITSKLVVRTSTVATKKLAVANENYFPRLLLKHGSRLFVVVK